MNSKSSGEMFQSLHFYRAKSPHQHKTDRSAVVGIHFSPPQGTLSALQPILEVCSCRCASVMKSVYYLVLFDRELNKFRQVAKSEVECLQVGSRMFVSIFRSICGFHYSRVSHIALPFWLRYDTRFRFTPIPVSVSHQLR
jgi:hypothetical protein